MKTLGSRISKLRKAKKLSRQELGELSGLKYPAVRIGEYENDKKIPRMQVIDRIANSLDVTRAYLLTGILDKKTMHSFYDSGILVNMYTNKELPMYYFQFSQFILCNEDILTECLDANDYEYISKIILEKIKKCKGTTNMLEPFMDKYQYMDYLQEQEELEASYAEYLAEEGVNRDVYEQTEEEYYDALEVSERAENERLAEELESNF